MTGPLYQTVIDTVVSRIASGELLAGAMLPSETQLAAETGVSQGTARKALMVLEQRGIVRRQQGQGTFVTARTPDSALFNFFRLRERDGTLVRPELVSEDIRERRATPIETQTLEGAPQAVFEINRVRSLSGLPSVIETSVVPAGLFPGLDRRRPLPNTLYVFYQQAYGAIVLRAEEEIEARAATLAQAEALGIAEGTPLLSIDRIAIDLLGRAIERRRTVCRTDRLAYRISLD